MFGKIWQYWVNKKKLIDTIHDQEHLIKGLHFSIKNQQILLEDYQALIAGLLLHCGSDEIIVASEFLRSAIDAQICPICEIMENGDVKVYLITGEQTYDKC